jgi:tripartite-type tricarboxylate transporter receptor subunit TctC
MRKASVALLVLAFASPLAWSQTFPNRPIRVLVPFTAGSGSDTAARFFGDRISATLGQPVVVENKPGADAVIAVMAAKSAPADGYTILLASISPIAVNPVVLKDLPYDPLRDFKPLSGLTRGMNVLVVAPGSSIKTLAELVAAAKKAPAPLSVGSYSMGYRLVIEWFAGLAGIKISYVPYKGAAPVFNDVMGRQLDYGIVDMGGAVSLIKAGKMRALAVSGEKRHPEAPGVPTIMESGYPELVTYSWTSFYVRSETPEDATSKLAGALQKALATNEAREFIRVTGGELMPYPPEAMRKFQRDELDRFRRIAEAAGIKPE